jgi:hypothetical protein
MLVYARQRYISSKPIHNRLRKNLNYYEYVSLMIPIFLLQDQETTSRDMPPSTTLALTVLFSSFLTGFYIYDLIRKNKSTEERLAELEHVVHESATVQETQLDTLHELDERIREKKDYDETEEIEEGKYQAWMGVLEDPKMPLTLTIWREKSSTAKKNLEWTTWDGTQDGSCIVRDFYLGNSNPDFSWILQFPSEHTVHAEMYDTLINGWDSVCKIRIFLSASKDDILNFVSQQEFEGSKTMNLVVKKSVEGGLLHWSRILIDA